MELFEVTLLLLAVAVVLMQVARRLRVPYPALLALVGGCVTALPFAPTLNIDPRLALAVFIAPAESDGGFRAGRSATNDASASELRRRPTADACGNLHALRP